jgi:hypothetical protein
MISKLDATIMEGPNHIIIDKTCSYTQQKVKKMVGVQTLKKKIDSYKLYVKTKDYAIKDVRSRITAMPLDELRIWERFVDLRN